MDILNNNFVLGMVIANKLPRREALLVGLAAGQIPPSSGMGPVLLKPIIDTQIRLRTERDAAVAQRTALEERIRTLEKRLAGKGQAEEEEDSEEDEEDEDAVEVRSRRASGGTPSKSRLRARTRTTRGKASARRMEQERDRQPATEGVKDRNKGNGPTDTESRARLSASGSTKQTNT